MVMMSNFTATLPGKVGLGAIGAGAVYAVAILMVDSLHHEARVQWIPSGDLVSMNDGAPGYPLTDRRHGIRLGWEYLCQGPAATLAHRHDDLPVALLVLGEPPIDPIGSQVRGPYVAAEIGSVDLCDASLSPDAQCLRGGRHGLCASTNAVLYWTSRSRHSASMLLPLTSLQKIAMAIR